MSDTTVNQFVGQFADAAALAAFIPSPPAITPSASVPLSGYFALQQDTGGAYSWNSDTAAWVLIGGSSGALNPLDLGAAGVRLTGANGVLTLLGLGGGADESLLIDLNTTANTIGLSSGSGATSILTALQLHVVDTTDTQVLASFEKTLLAGATPGYQAVNDVYLTLTPTTDGTGFDNIYGTYNVINTSTAFDIYVVVGHESDIYSATTTGSTTAAAIGFQGVVIQTGTGTIGQATGFQSYIDMQGAGVITDATGFYAYSPVNGAGTITNYYAFYSKNLTTAMATHPYFLWYDGGGGDANGGGVFRVNEFGILAYYNPAFAAYVPGAADFEREILRWGDTGVYGTDNIAYFGVEVGGTGTNRLLSLVGAGVQIESVPGTSTFLQMAELTAPSAPAANGVRIYAEDNGGGKTRLMALFASGAAQQIAIQP